MAKKYRASSPADFPDPHRFGMWNGFAFGIYPNLSQIKSAISSVYTDGYGFVRSDLWIYEHDGHRWQEIYALKKGEPKIGHKLWKDGVAPKTLVVSDEAVDAAIESIMKAGEA